jgi:DnaJ-class molecular chaperone
MSAPAGEMNFYLALGVPQTETAVGIQRAFRELALRYHADRPGSRSAPFFQDIVEAYRVLSDPERRSSYNQTLRQLAEVTATAPPIAASSPEPESIAPTRLSLFRDFEVTTPSFEEVFERYFKSFTEPSWPKSQRLDALNVELELSSDEAARGTALTLGVPVFYPCRACRGSGYSDSYACLNCDTQGMVESEEEARIVIPAMVRDGTALQIPLRGLGMQNQSLHVLIRVA